ncbi:MAG TPA: response regulator [Candidatus Saccharimonadia bacterium]|nr:response regulator [Candidatus Saccharimonadia bacterium]
MLPSVMIVEDDPAIREVYVIKFEIEGYPVVGAENGKQALDLLEQFNPDIILLDMMMPVMGGLEFMRHFRGRNHGADVIVFSNMSAPDQIKAALSLGACDYWIKSDYTPELIVKRVRERWGSRKQPDPKKT